MITEGFATNAKKPRGPISRVLSRTIIYLVCTLPRSSSHATRTQAGPARRVPICACSGWGLPSRRVATTLVVSYTTVSAFPFTPKRRWESSFLRRFPSDHSARPLAGIPPYGARTFLTPTASGGSRDRLALLADGILAHGAACEESLTKSFQTPVDRQQKSSILFYIRARRTLYLIAWNGSFTKSLR